MIVGDALSYSEVVTLLAETETQLGRTINPTLCEQADFARKLGEENPFVNSVVGQPLILLAGSKDDIVKPGKSG
ncbi:MAG: hypothetical protein R3F50_21605 [Gammaproteobacteria bacterium]